MDFQPIASYGFIGNLGSAALVSQQGSIDWCCLPRIDSPSVFAALLDPEKGGKFSIRPTEMLTNVRQYYQTSTNILVTEFTVEGGVLELTDWMHMGGFVFEELEQHRVPAVYRRVFCPEGEVRVDVRFDPKLNYARTPTELTTMTDGILAEGRGECVRLHAPCAFTIGVRGAEATVRLREGEELVFICIYGNVPREDLPQAHRSLDKTRIHWTRWIAECESGACILPTEFQDEVIRSSLVLKVLAGGHGIAAAATTSLPEIIGGSANWDYRFNWIRDTSFTVQALTSLGHIHDAREFLDWVCGLLVTGGHRPSELKVLYPLHSLSLMHEEGLPHLRGYRDSRPVRIGNAAAEQVQLDIYGEILETVFRAEHLHPGVDQALSGVLRNIVDYVCDVWRNPDHGIWELRGEPAQYVYSKVMCWVALDRGIRLAEEHGWHADLALWRQERDTIKTLVMERGFSERRNSFMQAFGSEVIDATSLLFPLLEFLPPDHPQAIATLETVQRELTHGALVYRSSAHSGKEGAFGLCSFWLVDALALAGRIGEAREHYLELLRHGNHLCLFAEEIDPATGMFLGNFPQAFTHVGLINSAVYLTRSQTTIPSPQPLMGEVHMPGGER